MRTMRMMVWMTFVEEAVAVKWILVMPCLKECWIDQSDFGYLVLLMNTDRIWRSGTCQEGAAVGPGEIVVMREAFWATGVVDQRRRMCRLESAKETWSYLH
jgi:hypothetical protein